MEPDLFKMSVARTHLVSQVMYEICKLWQRRAFRRTDYGLDAVANKAGMTEAYLRDIIECKKDPTLRDLAAIAYALGAEIGIELVPLEEAAPF